MFSNFVYIIDPPNNIIFILFIVYFSSLCKNKNASCHENSCKGTKKNRNTRNSTPPFNVIFVKKTPNAFNHLSQSSPHDTFLSPQSTNHSFFSKKHHAPPSESNPLRGEQNLKINFVFPSPCTIFAP